MAVRYDKTALTLDVAEEKNITSVIFLVPFAGIVGPQKSV